MKNYYNVILILLLIIVTSQKLSGQYVTFGRAFSFGDAFISDKDVTHGFLLSLTGGLSITYADNEHLFFDSENASAMANSATSARVAMNGNSGVIKSNFNNLFTHDLVDCMPTYSIFIMKNGKNLYNTNGMFQVQSLEAMYGVDKITDISVQFSEETRVKTCLFNVVDDSTSYSAFGF